MKTKTIQFAKALTIVLLSLVFIAPIFGQAPEKMSYQAVIRDASNNLVVNQSVGMKVTILQGSADGTVVYCETQNRPTNANGLLAIEIGTGTVVSGNFATIDWADGPYFIKTETDPGGGANYTISGTSQLLSVPYAFHAKKADSLVDEIVESDPTVPLHVKSITTDNIDNWDEAHTWGNHTGAGYLTSYTEIDPTWEGSANQAGSIGRSGNVGIGIVNPNHKLEVGGNAMVDGNVTSNNFYYSSPKVRYMNIGEADFTIGNSGNGDIVKLSGMGGAGIVNSTTSFNLIAAPVHLPHGAIVTNIDVVYYDNSETGDMVIAFQGRNNYSINNYSTETTSGAVDTPRTISFTPNITIDNSVFSYAIRVYSTGWPTDNIMSMRIYHVIISYTILETD